MGGAQGQWPCCVYLFPPWRTGTGTLPCLHCGWPFLALPLRRFARAVRLGRDARQSRARATPSPHGAPLSRARSSHALPRPSARAGRILTGQAGARGRPRRKHSCKIISRTHKHLAPTQVTVAFKEYQVIGRRLPTESVPEPKLFRMRVFAPNEVVAKSRYWYFLQKLHKVKKASGEVVSINVISEAHPTKVKNFGVWVRYDSRSGTHNMYKEIRDVTRVGAVESLYQDMAARHRARFRSIHILKVVELEKTADVKRPYVKQFLTKDLKFPLPHRIQKSDKIFAYKRPTTFY